MITAADILRSFAIRQRTATLAGLSTLLHPEQAAIEAALASLPPGAAVDLGQLIAHARDRHVDARDRAARAALLDAADDALVRVRVECVRRGIDPDDSEPNAGRYALSLELDTAGACSGTRRGPFRPEPVGRRGPQEEPDDDDLDEARMSKSCGGADHASRELQVRRVTAAPHTQPRRQVKRFIPTPIGGWIPDAPPEPEDDAEPSPLGPRFFGTGNGFGWDADY